MATTATPRKPRARRRVLDPVPSPDVLDGVNGPTGKPDVVMVLGHELVRPVCRVSDLGPNAPQAWRESALAALAAGRAAFVVRCDGVESVLVTNGPRRTA